MPKILFHGVEYKNADEMPANVRAAYDKAVQMLPDRDANGIPDLLESDGSAPAALPLPVPGTQPPVYLTQAARAAVAAPRWLPWVIVGAILGVFACVFLMFFGIMSLMKSSGAYQLAITTVQASPTAMEILGSPIRDGWIVSGSTSETGASGTASLSIPLDGSQQSGTLNVEAVKEEDTWRLISLILSVGHQDYDLLKK